jgi:UDP:flavonoid glycosyltransferase YjiC (YdhE family)
MGKGLGHVGRCIPIANRLIERDADVIFSTYQEGIDYIKKERLPLIKAPPIDLQVKPDGSVDFRQTVVAPGPFLASYTLMKQVNAEIESIQSFKPDLVISDSRASPLMAAKILGIPSTCILNQFQVIIPRRQHLLRLARFADFVTLTFIGKIWTAGSRVLIPDFPQPYTISKGNLSIPKSYRKKVELIGAILPIRPDELPDKRELRKRLKLPVDKPVIFAPISGPIKERTFLIEILRKLLLQFPEKYEVVLSFGYPNADTEPIDYGNLRIFKWVPNRFDYLKACDVVISRAGHGTLTQCICYGKPVVIIPTPGHTEQLNNAMRAKKLGVANIINQKRISKQVLLEKIQQILTSDTSTNVEKIQKAVLEHNGLENAVNKIIETAQESV